MRVEAVTAGDAQKLESVRTLFREYESVLGVSLCFQSFEDELASLPGKYSPDKRGDLLLASDENEIAAGCVAIYEMEANVCELKRLFVREQFQGRGLGRKLTQVATDKAIGLGYQTMVLDTLARLEPACQLYRSLGFQQTRPYNENPHDDVLYFRKSLTQDH